MTRGPKPTRTPHRIIARLRKARERKGLSQRQVEQTAGLSNRAVARLEDVENGTMILFTLDKIAAAVGMRLTIVSQGRREYDIDTVEAACDTICKLCLQGVQVARRADGQWLHVLHDKYLRCAATASREALREPLAPIREKVLEHHEQVEERRKERYINKRRQQMKKFDRQAQEEGEALLDRHKGKGQGIPE